MAFQIFDEDVDSEGDMIGVVLDEPEEICGRCMGKLERISKNEFFCQKCNKRYILDQ